MMAYRPELLALLEAVKDEPDADAPRLILADWLDDHGDGARAEFIRLQVHLARDPLNYSEPWREERRRAGELLKRFRAEWLGPLTAWPLNCEFRRGLIRAHGNGELFQRNEWKKPSAREDLAWADHLRLMSTSSADMVLLAEWPALAGIAGLTWEVPSPPSGRWASLFRSPFVNRLRQLKLRILTDVDLCEWSDLPPLSRLQALDLSKNRLSAAAGSLLARWPQLETLRELKLASNPLGDEGVTALAASPLLEGLTTLDLGLTDLGDKGLAALAQSRYLSNLTDLDLRGSQLGKAGVAALARAATLRPRRLVLGRAGRSARADVAALIRSPLGDNLADLDLSVNGLANPAVHALAESPRAARLEKLDLAFNSIGLQGAVALAKSPYLRQLKVLYLQGNPIPSAGVEALLKSPHLAQLQFFSCDEFRLTKRVRAKYLARFAANDV